MPQDVLSVSCVGLVSPLGYTPQSSAAALRARIPAFTELVYRERSGENIIGAMVPDVPIELRGRERLSALARLLFETLSQELMEQFRWSQIPIFVCVPERERPGPRLLDELASLGPAFRFPDARHIEAGQTSAFEALAEARALLANPRVAACAIVAVDSMIDARVLTWLDGLRRLKTSE